MAAKRKPEPRVVSEVCSMCGLDWKLHGLEPTTETCIELLLAEVRSLNAQLAVRPIMRPLPYPQPYPVPYPMYPRPWPHAWQITYGANSTTGRYASGLMPQLSSAQPHAVISGSTARGLAR